MKENYEKKKLKLIIYFYIYFKAQPYSMITTISQFNPTKPRYRTHKWLRALLNPFQQHQESNHYSIAQLNQSIKQTKNTDNVAKHSPLWYAENPY